MNNEALLRLLSAAAQGDQNAFANLYEDTSSLLFSLCLKMLRRRDWAEDVLQDAYVKIWYHADQYHAHKGSVLGWMISITRYRALDFLKRKEHQLFVDTDIVGNPIDEHSKQTDMGDQLAGRETLQRCLEDLKADQRKTIELAFVHGLTHHELAHHLGKPLGTIKTWVRRGLAQLRDCLAQ